MEPSEAWRLREREEENQRLKCVVANLALESLALKDAVLGKYDRS